MNGKKALLAVSFGTSHGETRKRTIEAVEKDLQDAFPQRRFYRAWTSRRILEKLRAGGGPCYDTVPEALARMERDGAEDVLIQPTFLIPGGEFAALEETVIAWRSHFRQVILGAPLLGEEADIPLLAKAIETIYSDLTSSRMLALMGHGGAESRLPVYTRLDEQFKKDGCPNFCVGTAEHAPGIAPALRQVRERRPKEVLLAPLLVAAGEHAIRDMAGDSPKSWKNQIEKEGPSVIPILRGMGEYETVRALYVRHAKQAEERGLRL